MKILFYFFVFSLSLTFFSCSNESVTLPESEIPEEAPLLILRQVQRQTVGFDCGPRIIDFNTDGQIIKSDLCGSIRDYIRDADGNLIEFSTPGGFPSFTGYSYDNGQLIGIATGNDTGGGFAQISYSDNMMTYQPIQNDGEPSPARSEYVFEDDSFEKPLFRMQINETEDTSFIGSTYGYNNNDDLISFDRYRFNSDLNEPNIFIERSFAYDDKVNPFRPGLPTNPIFSELVTFIDFGNSDLFFHGKHNITQEVLTNHLNNFTRVLDYEYEYNDEGYPVSITRYRNGELQATFIFEYY